MCSYIPYSKMYTFNHMYYVKYDTLAFECHPRYMELNKEECVCLCTGMRLHYINAPYEKMPQVVW